MGYTIKEVREPYIPQEILETHFFQECVSELQYLPGGAVDHVGIYECEQKTGDLLAGKRWVKAHPRYKELSDYVGKVLNVKIEDPEDAILFSRGALEMLDRGSTLPEASRLGLGLQYAVKYSTVAPMQVQASHEVVSVTFTQSPKPSYKQRLKELSKDDMRSIQGNCVFLWTQHLIKNKVPQKQAEKQAMSLLGNYGLDGKYGSKTHALLAKVLKHLSEEGVDLKSIHNTQQLVQVLRSQALAYPDSAS